MMSYVYWYGLENAYKAISGLPMYSQNSGRGMRLIYSQKSFLTCINELLPERGGRFLLSFTKGWPLRGRCLVCRRDIDGRDTQGIAAEDMLEQFMDITPDFYSTKHLRTHCCYCDHTLANMTRRMEDVDFGDVVNLLMTERLAMLSRHAIQEAA